MKNGISVNTLNWYDFTKNIETKNALRLQTTTKINKWGNTGSKNIKKLWFYCIFTPKKQLKKALS